VAPSLPVEVIARIIELASGSPAHKWAPTTSLLPLLCVSAIFRAEAERLLYASLVLSRPAHIIKCFQTIVKRPSAARAVRSLVVSLPSRYFPDFSFAIGGAHPREENVQLAAFARLISSALKCMKGLRIYRISTFLPPVAVDMAIAGAWLTQGSFRLSQFSSDLDLSPRMLEFLRSQPSITEFHGPVCSPQHPLPADILPNLGIVMGAPRFLQNIVPTRPVTTVCVTQQVRSPQIIDMLVPRLAVGTHHVSRCSSDTEALF
jgi:hypothetical protein